MADFDDVELEFVKRTLREHGEYLVKILRESIEEKDLLKDGILIDSIDYKVSEYSINPILYIEFKGYGRAIEIAWHKRKKTSKNTNSWEKSVNQDIWGFGQTNKKKKARKDARWYSKNVYGSLNRLIGILSYELSDELRKKIKKDLTKKL